MRWSDVKKYGLGPAQVNMMVNDVILASIYLFSKKTGYSKKVVDFFYRKPISLYLE